VLIQTRMEYNQGALDVLQVRPPKPSLYGPDGRVPGFGAL
jgi:flagella synthesis protein FlgN